MSCNIAAHAAMRAMTHPDKDLNQTDRCVFAWLVYRANGVHKCYKTVEDIQSGLNIGTRQTVSAATRKLREKGLIDVKRRFHDSNHYEILDPGGYLYGDWSSPHVKNSDHVRGDEDVRETDPSPAPHVKETDHPYVKDSDHVGVSTCKEILPYDVKKTDFSPPSDVKKTDQEVQVPQVSTQERTQRVHRPKAGALIPSDWTPTDEDRAYAISKGVDPDLAAEEHLGYWSNRADAKAKKLDWSKAFQTTVRMLMGRSQFRLRAGKPTALDPSKLSGAQAALFRLQQERALLEDEEKRQRPFLFSIEGTAA